VIGIKLWRQFIFGAILMGGNAMDGARSDTPPDDA